MIITILLLAFLLRLIGLDQSFWLDESIGVLEISKHGFEGILTQFLRVDNHPPLYYLALEIWSSIFGYSEIAIRMLSVIAGVGTVALTYLICRSLLPKEKGFAIIVSLLLATSQFHIYYSQEARMYSQTAFFACLAIYSYLKLLKESNTKNYAFWLLFSFSLVGLFFTDYMPVLLWPVFIIVALVKKTTKKWWLLFIASHVPLIIFGILWLPTFLIQTQGGKWLLATLPSWKTVAGGATVKNAVLVWNKFVFGRISLLNKTQYYLLIAAASIPIALSILFSFKKIAKYLLIFFWLFIPLIAGFFISLFFPAFNYFRFTYIIPAFYIVIGLGIWQLKSIYLRNFLIGIILLFNLVSFSIYIFDKNQQREQWRQAVEFLETYASAEDVVLFEYPEPFTPYRWYQKEILNASGSTDSISANAEPTAQRTASLIESTNRVFHFEYLSDLTDPSQVVKQTLMKSGFTMKASFSQFVGIGVITEWIKN